MTVDWGSQLSLQLLWLQVAHDSCSYTVHSVQCQSCSTASYEQQDSLLQFNVINYSAPWVCVSLLCAKPLARLQGVQPPKRIMGSPLLAPLVLVGAVFALQQGLAQYALQKQPWYQATTDQVRQLT